MNYVILSLKHSEGNSPCFWRADDAGYTNHLFSAGIYTEEQVKKDPGYYNNGFSTLAIPATTAGLESIGYKETMDLNKVEELRKELKK